MATSTLDRIVSVLVGPSCPTCEPDDLHRGAPSGALRDGRCRDCGTEYRWYEAPHDDRPEALCPGCGCPSADENGDSITCEDCGPSDCAYCGTTVYRWQLSENLACQVCEMGEAA
jgi:hypothetical protein